MGETFGSCLGPRKDSFSGGIKQNQSFPGIQERITVGNEILPAIDKIGSLAIKSNILAIGRITEDGRKSIDMGNEEWLVTELFARRTMAGDIDLLGDESSIIRVGKEIFPLTEVERCLERHKEIIEAAVVKVSEKGDFAAFYKAEKKSSLDSEKLFKHLKKRIGAQLLPAEIIRIQHFERFPTGQINRKKLVEEYVNNIGK